MSISGSSGSLGGLPQTTVTEREQTASNEILKVGGGLAITQDTLELGFYELGGQIGRYPANPSRPTLPPLVSTRGPSEFTGEEADIQQALEALVNTLPAAVRNDYEAEMARPADSRNLNFVALDAVLTTVAKALVWTQDASGPSTTEGIKAASQAINLAISHAAIEGLIGYAGAVLAGAKDFLDSVGANYPQQDGIRGNARLIDDGMKKMQGLKEEADSSGELPVAAFSDLFSKMSLLLHQYNSVSTGSDLTILGITLSTMTSLTAALALSSTLSPALFLSLATSAIGIDSASSETGVLSPSISSTIAALAAGIGEISLSEANLPAGELLSLTLAATVIGAMGMVAFINEVGVAFFAGTASADAAAANSFYTELAFVLLANSGAVSSVLSPLVEAFDLPPRQQLFLENSLNMIALTAMILAAIPQRDSEAMASMLSSLQSQIALYLNPLSDLISEGVLDQTIDSQTAASIGISLQQAKLALEAGDASDFMTALLSPLSLIGSTNEQFMAELKGLESFIASTSRAVADNMNDQTNQDTRVSIIA